MIQAHGHRKPGQLENKINGCPQVGPTQKRTCKTNQKPGQLEQNRTETNKTERKEKAQIRLLG